MKIRNYILSILAGAAALVGCSKLTPTISEPYAEALLSENNVSIALEGGSVTVQFTAETSWNIVTTEAKGPDGTPVEYVDSKAQWLDASPKSGTGSATITVTATPNTGDIRNGSIHFQCGGKDVYMVVYQEGAPAGEALPSTCEEVIAGTDGVSYLVTGTCSRIANTSYGNWYLTDDTGTIYIYGTVNASGQYPKDATGGWEAFGIEVGDKVTVKGPRTNYNGTIELVDVEVVSVEKSLIQTDQSSVSVPAESGTFELTFTSKANGTTVTTDVDWLHITDIEAAADGSMVVTLAFDPNTTTAARTGNINIKAPDAVKVVPVTQEGLPPTGESISDIVAKEDNSQVEALESTIVSARTQRGFIATDGRKAIYVYNSDAAAAVKVGDAITFKGTKVTYNGVPEISPLAEYTVISSGNSVSYPRATDITADVLTYEATEAEFIQFTGTLAKSGNYYNITFDGVDPETKQGSIVYPVEELGADAFDGKSITVKGYFNGLSSAGKFINIIATGIEEGGGGTPVDYDTVSDIIGFSDGTEISSEALVSAVCTSGFIVTDGKKALYVYTNRTDFNGIAQVGDYVSYKGTKTTYNGVPEISPVTEVTVVSSGNPVNYPAVKDITSSFVDYSATEAEFITFTGTLSVSGNYYNVAIPGVDTETRQGSVSYPAESLNAASWDGKEVKVTGYFNGASGGGRYVNVIAVSLQEPGTPDPPTGDGDDPAALEIGNSLSGMLSLASGTEVSSDYCVVGAVCQRGYVAVDKGTSVLVYYGSNWTPDVKVGDVVKFTGKYSPYNGLAEIASPVTTTVAEGYNVPALTSTDITSSLDNFTSSTSSPITVTCTSFQSGTYTNFSVDGATKVVSLYYPDNSIYDTFTVGDKVKLTGYWGGLSSDGARSNVIVTKLEVVTQ